MVDALPAKDRKLLGGTMPVLGVDVTGTGTAFVPRRCKVPSYAHQGAQALEVCLSLFFPFESCLSAVFVQ